MFRLNHARILALLCLLALLLVACGNPNQRPGDTDSEEAPEVSSTSLSSSTWSSPNGATVHLSVVPSAYVKGQSATFLVRLEGEDIASRPGEWDGSKYTASIDLNAADGYCYFVRLDNPNGKSNEITLNAPTAVTNEALINLADALNAYCSASVADSTFADNRLTLLSGSVLVQAPRITNDGQSITCTDAQLVLRLYDAELGRKSVVLSAAPENGQYKQPIEGVAFDLPALEDDQQLDLTVEVSLSNGQTLSAPVGSWFYMNGTLQSSVG